MSVSATAAPAIRAAFTDLIDYAGLFPPAQLDMAAALAEYLTARAGPHAWMLSRFIVPASRLPELLAGLPPRVEPIRLSVILDAGSDARAWLDTVRKLLGVVVTLCSQDKRVLLEMLEAPLPSLESARDSYDAPIGQFNAVLAAAGLGDLPAFLEIPKDGRWKAELASALCALARYKLGAKLRCGGTSAQAFPDATDVTTFICTALQQAGVAMKATAGLHHPVRHLDTHLGVEMHGFLNIMAAAGFAWNGMQPERVLGVVACENPKHFEFGEHGLAWESERLHVEQLQQLRAQAFISYGSCSFSDPVADLQSLGML